MRTQAQSECKLEADDDKATALTTASMLPAADDIQRLAKLLGASPPSLVASAESPVRLSPAFTVATNNIDYTYPHGYTGVTTDPEFDVKSTDDDRFPNRDAVGASADNETLPVRSAEMAAFESSQRVRWLSGVSCTSSSTSGGEESPRPAGSTKNANSSLSEWFSGSRLSPYHGHTSTPVNGWLESTRAQSQHAVREAGDIGQLDGSSGSVDGHGSVISTASASIDGVSFRKSPNTSNTGTSLGSASSIERLYHPGIGHVQDNRQGLASNTSPENRWNSRLSIPEPFWASRTALFQSHTAAIQPGGASDGSRTPPSFNGGFSDVPNSVQLSQNISPSTPLAAPPSKKRVCLNCFKSMFSVIFVE